MKKKKYSRLDDNTVRVLKINKEALFEFICESMLDNQETFLEVNSSDVVSCFDIDFEQGELIMCAYKNENSKGDALTLPESIDLQTIMKNIDNTTDSMYNPKPNRYKDYTKEALMELSKMSKQ